MRQHTAHTILQFLIFFVLSWSDWQRSKILYREFCYIAYCKRSQFSPNVINTWRRLWWKYNLNSTNFEMWMSYNPYTWHIYDNFKFYQKYFHSYKTDFTYQLLGWWWRSLLTLVCIESWSCLQHPSQLENKEALLRYWLLWCIQRKLKIIQQTVIFKWK